MLKKIGMIALASTLAAGCASVPMESKQITKVAKQFYPPSVGRAGLYIYRDTSVGGALKKMYGLMENASAQLPRLFFSMKKLKVVKATKFLQNLSSPQTTCLLKLKAVCIILFNKI
jgi:hypothetical protein